MMQSTEPLYFEGLFIIIMVRLGFFYTAPLTRLTLQAAASNCSFYRMMSGVSFWMVTLPLLSNRHCLVTILLVIIPHPIGYTLTILLIVLTKVAAMVIGMTFSMFRGSRLYLFTVFQIIKPLISGPLFRVFIRHISMSPTPIVGPART